MKQAILSAVALVQLAWLRFVENLRPVDGVALANIAEGAAATGNITKLTDAALTERYLVAKVGSGSDRVGVCGIADTPIGVITDEASAAGEEVNVFLLGAGVGTIYMVASAAIAQGALLENDASGRVKTLAGTAGAHHVVGRALSAASAAGDVIEVDPFYFIRAI